MHAGHASETDDAAHRCLQRSRLHHLWPATSDGGARGPSTRKVVVGAWRKRYLSPRGHLPAEPEPEGGLPPLQEQGGWKALDTCCQELFDTLTDDSGEGQAAFDAVDAPRPGKGATAPGMPLGTEAAAGGGVAALAPAPHGCRQAAHGNKSQARASLPPF